MKQRKLIDVSLMGDDYNGNRQSSARSTTSSRASSRSRRRSTKNISNRFLHSSPSERSIVTTTTLIDNEFKSSVKSSRYSQSASNPTLTLNGKSTDSCLTSRGSSRVTSGVSHVTLSSGRHRSVMTSSTTRSSVAGSCASFSDRVGSYPGRKIWTIENGYLQHVNDSDQGFFHQGNVYLVLKVAAEGSTSLHVWFGSQSSQTDKKAMMVYASKLDKTIEGANVFSKENQGKETQMFLNHFRSGLVVVEGKSKSDLSRSCKYSQRMYLVEGRDIPTATCTKCSATAVKLDRALILDGFPRMYVWLGQEIDNNTRVKAIQVASTLRTRQRKGIAHIIVIEKKDTALHKAFLQKLSPDEDSVEEVSRLEVTEEERKRLNLYRVTGDRVLYDMSFVAKKPLQHKYLTSKDCFVLDQGPNTPVYIWVGSAADSETLYSAMDNAQNFTQHHNYPTTTPICRLMEGSEPISFKAAFNDWSDRVIKERQLVRSYNVANIGRALFSSSDRRTISQVTEVWSDDQLPKNNGKTEVWRIDGEKLTQLMWEERGVFHDWQCYILLNKEPSIGGEVKILYYWLGSKCTNGEKDVALNLVFAISSSLQHQALIMRILDGKETKHFMNVLQNSMVVYDADFRENIANCPSEGGTSFMSGDSDISENSENIKMFCIQEFHPGSMRVFQVSPRTSTLNSSATFVIFNSSNAFVWYGKNSTASEREYSKNMLSYFCPQKTRQFDIMNEKKETLQFYNSLIQDGSYHTEFTKHVIHRRPPRLALYNEADKSFFFYDGFFQEDLNEANIFLLDTFDQIQTWCGNSAMAANDHKCLSSIVQAYLDQDIAGRDIDDINICYVIQRSEPDSFVKYFRGWDEFGYGGKSAFEASRKRTRQENALINIDAQMVDLTYTTTTKLSFKELVKTVDDNENINLRHKESHLSDKDFTAALRMTRAQFYRLPEWKQRQILKSAKLLKPSTTAMGDAYSGYREPPLITINFEPF